VAAGTHAPKVAKVRVRARPNWPPWLWDVGAGKAVSFQPSVISQKTAANVGGQIVGAGLTVAGRDAAPGAPSGVAALSGLDGARGTGELVAAWPAALTDTPTEEYTG
jgi:hypothetical protein